MNHFDEKMSINEKLLNQYETRLNNIKNDFKLIDDKFKKISQIEKK